MNDDVILRREAACFSRLLCGIEISPRASDAYVEAHAHVDGLSCGNAFQRLLIRHASRGVFFARMADGYARFFDKHGPLRHKMVLLLAILESTPPSHPLLDAPVGGSFVPAVIRLVAAGLRAVACIALGTLLFTPLRLITRGS